MPNDLHPMEPSLVEAMERALDRGVLLDPWLFADGHGARLAGRAIRVEAVPMGSDRIVRQVTRRSRRTRS